MVRDLQITVLVDNDVRDASLVGEHGLSMWVKADGRRILFDTGAGKALPQNAAVLGVNLATADAVVLSHGHADHTGGLATVLEQAPRARIVAHPAALEAKYTCSEGAAPRAAGMATAFVRALGSADRQRVPTRGPTEIAPGVWVTGEVPRRTDFEDTGGRFCLDPAGQQVDTLVDDQSMWIDSAAGIVVVCGCAHSGIVNTLNAVARAAGRESISAVIGGTHLLRASPERLEQTARALEGYNVRLLATCHCTGKTGQEFFHRRLPERAVACVAGSRFVFDKGGRRVEG